MMQSLRQEEAAVRQTCLAGNCCCCQICTMKPWLAPALHAQIPLSHGLGLAFGILISCCVPVLGVQPILNEATLAWQGRILKPVQSDNTWIDSYQVGTNVFVLTNATVSAFTRANHELNWVISGRTNVQFQWLASSENIAYLRSFPQGKISDEPGEISPLKRLDLKSGKWLADLLIPDPGTNKCILGICAESQILVLLSASINPDGFPSPEVKAYRVSCFTEPNGQLRWSKSFTAVPEAAPASAFLLSPVRPNEAVSDLHPVALLGADILVCAGPRQPLMRLSSLDGSTKWSLERVWEYERGFIGPSVWSHYISRFGKDDLFAAKKSDDAAATRTFSNRWDCNIIGGPIVISCPPTGWEHEPTLHVFIAVAKASAERSWPAYLADCILYEFDDEGKPLSMVKLPRMVDGSQVQIVDRGIVWNCQNNSMVRLKATSQESFRGVMEPGSSDLLTKVNWYREFDANEQEKWLAVDKAGDPVAFGKTHAFRVLTGGYVNGPDEKEFNLPLVAIDYTNGIPEPLLLKIPLDGTVPLPKTNIRSSANYNHTWGPYLLGITALQANDNALTITLGMDHWTGRLTFPLPPGF